jgi:hypothetical protein
LGLAKQVTAVDFCGERILNALLVLTSSIAKAQKTDDIFVVTATHVSKKFSFFTETGRTRGRSL